MRKLGFVVGILVALTAICVVAFKVQTIEATGFVGPDIFWESDSFFAVYDPEDGHFLVDVNVDTNSFCPRLSGFCTDVGDATYFGDVPQIGDTVRVREYFLWFNWEDPGRLAAIVSLTLVDILPPAEHVDAVPFDLTIEVTVDGQGTGIYDNLGDVMEDVIIPAVVESTSDR